MATQINSYELEWDTINNRGAIRVLLQDASESIPLNVASNEVWIATAMILGKPQAYLDESGVVSIGPRSVGR